MNVYPFRSENNDFALRCLFFGPRGGIWTKIGHEITQRLRASGVGYDYGMTGVYQMAAERASYVTRTYKSYFHNHSPFFCSVEFSFKYARKFAKQLHATAGATQGRENFANVFLGFVSIRWSALTGRDDSRVLAFRGRVPSAAMAQAFGLPAHW
jgi:hypothetical protein